MAVKVIVELKASPGRRDELRSRIEQVAAGDWPSGYQGSTSHESPDHAGRVLALLAVPVRATVIRRLP